MNFIGKAIPITNEGLKAASQLLQLPPGDIAALWTILEVATAGLNQGFGYQADRRPHILFERHKFREFTKGRFDEIAPDISGPAGGYGSLSHQYPKLERALLLCESEGLGKEPALKAASWGIGQVMGFNHEAAGYPSAEAMITETVATEDAQLLAIANLMCARGFDSAIRARNWRKLAQIYTGSGYAENLHDLKFEAQYMRFSTGSTPNVEVRTAQAALLVLGFSPGRIDGIIGDRTKNSLRALQNASGLPVSTEVTTETYQTLYRAAFS